MAAPDIPATVIPDRRSRGNPASDWLAAELNSIKTDIDELKTKIDDLDTDVRSGVPDGGFQKHLEYHRKVEEDIQIRKERWNKIVSEFLTKGGWAAVIFIVYSVWEAIKAKVTS